MLVWEPDVHLNATFHQLFTNEIQVHNTSVLGKVGTLKHTRVYDYITHPVDWQERKPVLDSENVDIYVYTAYSVIGTTRVTPVDISRELRALETIQTVEEIIDRFKLSLAASELRISDLFGVHIRMQNNLQIDIPGIEKLKTANPSSITTRMRATAETRNLCHVKSFEQNIRRRLEKNHSAYFFITTDSRDVLPYLRNAFGEEKVLSIPDSSDSACYGRESRQLKCIQFALADLIILANTRELILSLESSYSEVAQKFAHRKKASIGCSRSHG